MRQVFPNFADTLPYSKQWKLWRFLYRAKAQGWVPKIRRRPQHVIRDGSLRQFPVVPLVSGWRTCPKSRDRVLPKLSICTWNEILYVFTLGYQINVPGRLLISGKFSTQDVLIRYRTFINFADFFLNSEYQILQRRTFEIFQHTFYSLQQFVHSEKIYLQENSLKKFKNVKLISTQDVYSIQDAY